jgi:hypothetical protein
MSRYGMNEYSRYHVPGETRRQVFESKVQGPQGHGSDGDFARCDEGSARGGPCDLGEYARCKRANRLLARQVNLCISEVL